MMTVQGLAELAERLIKKAAEAEDVAQAQGYAHAASMAADAISKLTTLKIPIPQPRSGLG